MALCTSPDVREAMVREKSTFLAGGAWWEEPPAAFRSKAPSLRGRRRRTRECGRPIVAAVWGSCGIWNRLECSLFHSCLELGEWYLDCVWAAREKCVRRRWRERDRRRNFVCAVKGGEGHEFGDGGDNVVGLRRYVLGDIGGGADGCASGDEALLSMGDVQGLGNGACRVSRTRDICGGRVIGGCLRRPE